MIRFLKGFFGKSKATEPAAPYKVETPAPLTPPVVDMTVFPNLTVDGHGDVHETKKPRARKPATKKVAEPKAPSTKKAPAKRTKPSAK